MTPLQSAQKFAAEYAGIKAGIVESLRKSGWSREDANEEADAREAKALIEWEARK